MQSLYEYAGRPTPESFPDRPAEEEYDFGRDRWRELLAREDAVIEEDGETLTVHFPEAMQTELYKYERDIPMEIQAEKRGLDVVIRMPEAFDEWIDEIDAGSDGWLSRIRELV